jgi:hypothetical protein
MNESYITLEKLRQRYNKFYNMANKCLEEGNDYDCELYKNMAKYYKNRIDIRQNMINKKRQIMDEKKNEKI